MPRKILYFLLLLVLSAAVMAGTKGRIKGKVVDKQTGEPLIGANVVILGTSSGASTDASGEYTILNIDAGSYDVKVSYIGYRDFIKRGIRVNADLTSYEDFDLSSEEISVGTIEVVAKKPLIQKDATSSVRISNSEDIKNLPVRGFQNIVSLQAGVVIYNNPNGRNEITIRGSRGDEVGYYLDGLNVTDPTGGTRITMANDALEEVQVETGGMTAEYGGSNAGVVRSQLKSGSSQYKASFEYRTDNVFFQSKDKFFNQTKKLGTYWHGMNEFSFAIGGPVPFTENKIKFFYNVNNYFERTGTRKDEPGFDFGMYETTDHDTLYFKGPAGVRYNDFNNRWTHSGTISFDYNPFSLRIGGTYTSNKAPYTPNGVGIANFPTTYMRNRINLTEETSAAISVRFTHVLSANMFYEVTGGYTYYNRKTYDEFMKDNWLATGDSVANAEAGAQWYRTNGQLKTFKDSKFTKNQTRYIVPVAFSYYDKMNIQTPYRTSAAAYVKGKTTAFNAKAIFSILTKYHSIKIGGEFKQSTVRFFNPGAIETYAQGLQDPKNTLETLLYAKGVNNYGYDIYGNEIDGNDGDQYFFKPKKPVEAAFFIQDKIDLGDLILNVGLRYDYFDIDNLKLLDPRRPELSIGGLSATGTLIREGFEKTEVFSSLSPRISMSFPVTDKTVFNASFGKYTQQPSVNDCYIGYHSLAAQIRGGFFINNPQGLDLRPTRVTKYEIGFRQELTDFLALEISGFYEDRKGQVYFSQYDIIGDSGFKAYMTKMNGDFATNKGVEVTLNMRRYERLSLNGYVSFTDASGTGTNPNSAGGIVGAPLDGVTVFRPVYVSPLGQNRAFKGSLTLDYRFGKDDGGPILDQLGINIIANFDSGRPFTYGDSKEEYGGNDARNTIAFEALNNSTTPGSFNVDLKIDKSFTLFDKINANVYVSVLNVFDIKNVQNVYTLTGSANDDGYLNNPNSGGKAVEKYGQKFKDIYKTIYFDYNGYYSDMRQILLGIRLEY